MAPRLVPVQGDPFAPSASGPRLTPVAGNPFAQAQAEPDTTDYGPTAGTGFWQRFREGMGKSFVDTVRGAAQVAPLTNPLVLGASMLPGDPTGARRQMELVQQGVDEARRLDAPLMETGGGRAGQFVGTAVQAFAAPGSAATLPGRVAVGGTQGAGLGALQPTATGESRGQNMLLGTAFGGAGGGVAHWLTGVGRNANTLTAPVNESIEAARAAGIPLNVSQTTGSPALQAVQAATRWMPFSGAAKGAQRQQQAFNRAVGRTFGADAPELTDDVMRAARQRLSDQFNDIYARNDVTITPDVARRLLAIERQAGQDMVAEQAQVVRNQVERIVREAGDGTMSGRKYQAVRTALQNAEKGDPNIARLVRALRSELDDAAAASVGPRDAATLARVRSQWANLRTTEDALRQVAGAGGNVRPASLFPLIRRGATPEMRVLAKVGQNVLKDGLGDSGTAQRAFYMNLIGGGGLASGALGAPVIAKAVATGAVLGRALNSNAASRVLGQGKPTKAIAGLSRRLTKASPAGISLVPRGAAAEDEIR